MKVCVPESQQVATDPKQQVRPAWTLVYIHEEVMP